MSGQIPQSGKFDDDSYSIVSETHQLRKGMPTVEEVLRTQGRRLADEELAYLIAQKAIPPVTQNDSPVLHKVTKGNENFYVLMVDQPPCACKRVAGKKERCDKHKNLKKGEKANDKSISKSAEKAADMASEKCAADTPDEKSYEKPVDFLTPVKSQIASIVDSQAHDFIQGTPRPSAVSTKTPIGVSYDQENANNATNDNELSAGKKGSVAPQTSAKPGQIYVPEQAAAKTPVHKNMSIYVSNTSKGAGAMSEYAAAPHSSPKYAQSASKPQSSNAVPSYSAAANSHNNGNSMYCSNPAAKFKAASSGAPSPNTHNSPNVQNSQNGRNTPKSDSKTSPASRKSNQSVYMK